MIRFLLCMLKRSADVDRYADAVAKGEAIAFPICVRRMSVAFQSTSSPRIVESAPDLYRTRRNITLSCPTQHCPYPAPLSLPMILFEITPMTDGDNLPPKRRFTESAAQRSIQILWSPIAVSGRTGAYSCRNRSVLRGVNIKMAWSQTA